MNDIKVLRNKLYELDLRKKQMLRALVDLRKERSVKTSKDDLAKINAEITRLCNEVKKLNKLAAEHGAHMHALITEEARINGTVKAR